MSEVKPIQDKDLLFDALNSMEEGLVVYDQTGCLRTCNQAFLDMYNYTPEQARVGVHFRELGEIDVSQGNVVVGDEEGMDYLKRKAAYRKLLKGSFTVKLQDGRWIRTTDRAMPDGGFVSVHVDVTDMKLFQEELRIAQLIAQKHEEELALLNENLEQQIANRTEELQEARARAERLARTEPLTGLKNRRAFFEAANITHHSAARYKKYYSVIMVDIDEFKEVNDNFGHLMGDQVLKTLARCIERECRKVDIAARLGGDEFIVILPETAPAEALSVANRVSGSFKEKVLKIDEKSLHSSISIGIADYREGDALTETVLSRADEALYQAKAEGRDRIVISK